MFILTTFFCENLGFWFVLTVIFKKKGDADNLQYASSVRSIFNNGRILSREYWWMCCLVNIWCFVHYSFQWTLGWRIALLVKYTNWQFWFECSDFCSFASHIGCIGLSATPSESYYYYFPYFAWPCFRKWKCDLCKKLVTLEELQGYSNFLNIYHDHCCSYSFSTCCSW